MANSSAYSSWFSFKIWTSRVSKIHLDIFFIFWLLLLGLSMTSNISSNFCFSKEIFPPISFGLSQRLVQPVTELKHYKRGMFFFFFFFTFQLNCRVPIDIDCCVLKSLKGLSRCIPTSFRTCLCCMQRTIRWLSSTYKKSGWLNFKFLLLSASSSSLDEDFQILGDLWPDHAHVVFGHLFRTHYSWPWNRCFGAMWLLYSALLFHDF